MSPVYLGPRSFFQYNFDASKGRFEALLSLSSAETFSNTWKHLLCNFRAPCPSWGLNWHSTKSFANNPSGFGLYESRFTVSRPRLADRLQASDRQRYQGTRVRKCHVQYPMGRCLAVATW